MVRKDRKDRKVHKAIPVDLKDRKVNKDQQATTVLKDLRGHKDRRVWASTGLANGHIRPTPKMMPSLTTVVHGFRS